MNSKRILFTLAAFLSLAYMPWWILFVLCLIGLAIFQPYYEALAMGFLADGLYGITGSSFLYSFPWTLSMLALFLLSFWVRGHIRLGAKN